MALSSLSEFSRRAAARAASQGPIQGVPCASAPQSRLLTLRVFLDMSQITFFGMVLELRLVLQHGGLTKGKRESKTAVSEALMVERQTTFRRPAGGLRSWRLLGGTLRTKRVL